ncbi:DUF3899 domain-containing protein [Paraliobacillus ryukyuensis]|uniref:DUF3899 domain-containing protein n=1 Tax=Paraliobacillus ryukyuensis TaxID=200904 RepID=UPI0009A6A740|nr:DUF3899 domain-containing protein [Paraliobacillus ryukyuensis]
MKRSKPILVFFIQIFCIIVLAYILNKNALLLMNINIFFYVSSIYLLLWLLFFTIKGGFFDGIVYSFRKVGMSIFSKKAAVEWEDKPSPSEQVHTRLVSFFRFQALGLIIILIALLIIYYQ